MNQTKAIYADWAAGAPLLPQAAQAMLAAAQVGGNPSSLHSAGRRAAQILEDARHSIAQAFGAAPDEVVFTSGGTEANNLALGLCAENRPHVVSSAIEHPSVYRTLLARQRAGTPVSWVRPEKTGALRAETIGRALEAGTGLVSVMAASNETGVIQPIEAVGRLCRERGVLFHCDGVQAAGMLPINMGEAGIDLLTISAHKFGGPAGAGALLCRRGAKPPALMQGGRQEMGRRPGTENLPGIAGMAVALSACLAHRQARARQVEALRTALEARLPAQRRCRVLGQAAQRLPGICCIILPGISGERALYLLDKRGILASAGAACSAGEAYSPGLMAMGLSEREAGQALRISLGPENTLDEVSQIAAALGEIIPA